MTSQSYLFPKADHRETGLERHCTADPRSTDFPKGSGALPVGPATSSQATLASTRVPERLGRTGSRTVDGARPRAASRR
ncbi:hypothetical protein MTO96_028013 [Rhipicephalus appendiculatus]